METYASLRAGRTALGVEWEEFLHFLAGRTELVGNRKRRPQPGERHFNIERSGRDVVLLGQGPSEQQIGTGTDGVVNGIVADGQVERFVADDVLEFAIKLAQAELVNLGPSDGVEIQLNELTIFFRNELRRSASRLCSVLARAAPL